MEAQKVCTNESSGSATYAGFSPRQHSRDGRPESKVCGGAGAAGGPVGPPAVLQDGVQQENGCVSLPVAHGLHTTRVQLVNALVITVLQQPLPRMVLRAQFPEIMCTLLSPHWA